MIKRLLVEKLNSRIDHEFVFNDDLNLFTGKNGSSKTTLLKVLWFLNCGKLWTLLDEVNFRMVELETTRGKIRVARTDSPGIVEVTSTDGSMNKYPEDQLRQFEFRNVRVRKAMEQFRSHAFPTLFFPTFRRIEGGFTMEHERVPDQFSPYSLRQAFTELSNRLSSPSNTFISSISTDDIVRLLTTQSARINERISNEQADTSDRIIQKIKARDLSDKDLIKSIQEDIESVEAKRVDTLKPFTALAGLVQRIFQYKGIVFSGLTIGEVSNAIASEKLSAGEKQMLSFICYNTFVQGSVIFIDEPELSLHPDWQRTLVPILLEQGSGNQFFMATHSPFIYAKYPEKEIILSEDRGDN
ncbi:MAG: ATP-binding protein [Flavobacteriales bacterium]